MADATFQDLMRAAQNAENAGDEAAARQLVQMAASLRRPAKAAGEQIDLTTPMTPRRALSEEEMKRETRRENVFGDTTAKAMAGPIAATKAFARGVVDPSQSPTAQVIPEWVPEGARPSLARAGDVAMTGIGALGTAYAGAAGVASEVIAGDQTQERKLARDLMMLGEVAVPELAGVSSVNLAAQKAARAAARLERPATEKQAAARAAGDLDVTPSLGAGGKGRAMTAAALEKVPVAGRVIERDAARFVSEVETAFDAVSKKIGPASGSAQAGEALQSGLSRFVTDFKKKSSELYNKVGSHIPEGTRIQAPNTVDNLRSAIAQFEGNPEIMRELGMTRWAAMADDLENGLSWQAAIDLRSSVGRALRKKDGPLKDKDSAILSQVYGDLTSDLETAANAASEDAAKAWARANNYYARGAERIRNDLDKTITADSPERAFEAFVNMAKDGRASANSKRMFRIKASMPSREWRKVSASIIDRMGDATPGAQGASGSSFSPGKFLTEWNKLSDEAKSVLIPSDLRREMNALAEISATVKSANAERNASNTGTVVVGAGIGAGAAAAPMTTALTLGAAWGSAKTLTNPRFLRAMNRAARGDKKALQAIAKGNGPLAQDARTVLTMTAAEMAGTAPAANVADEPRTLLQN